MTFTAIVGRLAVIGIGLALMGLGYTLRRQYQRLRRHGTRTTGTIIDYDDGPIVRFYPPEQQPVTVRPHGPNKARRPCGAAITPTTAPPTRRISCSTPPNTS